MSLRFLFANGITNTENHVYELGCATTIDFIAKMRNINFNEIIDCSKTLVPNVFDDHIAGDKVSGVVGNLFYKLSLSFDQICVVLVLIQIITATGSYTIDNHREVERLIKVAQSNGHNRTNGMTSSGAQ